MEGLSCDTETCQAPKLKPQTYWSMGMMACVKHNKKVHGQVYVHVTLWKGCIYIISICSWQETVLEAVGTTMKKTQYKTVQTAPLSRNAQSHWVFQHQCCFSGRPPRNWVHSQNRKRTGYWLHSTPKWALWFSAVSHQLSEQCAANKKHFINIPSGRNPLPVNIVPRRVLAPQKIVHSGGSCLQLMGQCWIKWNATGHVTMLTSMFFYSSYCMLMHALPFISDESVTGS